MAMHAHLEFLGMTVLAVMNNINENASNKIVEYSLAWPGNVRGSTHELAISSEYIFVTGQNLHQVAKCNHDGIVLAHYEMPDGSGPHGILLNKHGHLWVSLEFVGLLVRLDKDGNIVQRIDVRLFADGAATPINTAPHGIGLDAYGETIWFTGKRTSTIDKVSPDGWVEHFQLNNLSALPIFLHAGPQGSMWGTELQGNAILHVASNGMVSEFPIPTPNSRPIAIIADPVEPCMWFTQEAGVKLGRVDMAGHITEFRVPALQKNYILGSLAFDRDHNLWVQVYVDHSNGNPDGSDYLLKVDRASIGTNGMEASVLAFEIHEVPSKWSMLHRIKLDPDGNLWFTEMMTDKLGKVTLPLS